MKEETLYDVIIIGAGLSGLVAAKNLGELGYKILILEARNRIGGRIHAIETPLQYPAEVGPLFINSQLLKTAFSLETILVEPDQSLIYDNEGHSKHLKDFMHSFSLEEPLKAATKKIQDAKAMTWQTYPSLEKTLRFSEQLIPKPGTTSYLARQFLTAMITHNIGSELDKISLLELTSEENIEMKSSFITGGFAKKIIAPLGKILDRLPNVDVQLSCPVHAVHQESIPYPKITTHAGGSYFGRSILCSVPLGVLKEGHIEFYPRLSKSKQHAIEHLKMGYCNRVVLEFAKPFWPEKTHFIYPGSNDINEWPEYFNLYYFSKQKAPTLIVTYYGKAAHFKNLTNEEIIDKALVPLRRLYKDKIQPLVAAYVSHWDSDPYALGTNTYCGLGTLQSDMDNIASAESHLFFAGEHTAGKHKGTLEGAYHSSFRASLEIASLLSRQHRLRKTVI